MTRRRLLHITILWDVVAAAGAVVIYRRWKEKQR